MAVQNTLSALSSVIFNTIYSGDDPAWVALKESKFLSEIGAAPDFGKGANRAFNGAAHTIEVKINPGSAVSPSHSVAIANRGRMDFRRFNVTRCKLYAAEGIDGEMIAAAVNGGAQITPVRELMRDITDNFYRVFADTAWSTAGGVTTRFTTTGCTVTNAYFTCDPINDAAKFEIGQKYQLSSDTGLGGSPAGLRDNGRELEVQSVNLTTGVVTFTTAINTVVGAVNTDYVFPSGFYSSAMTGIFGWVPIADPSASEDFFGVDRSVHPTRLAGYRYTGTGGSKLTAIRKCCSITRRLGANLNRCYVSTNDWDDIVSEVEGKGLILLPKADAKLGHQGISVETTQGTLIVVAEARAIDGRFHLLNVDDWKFKSAGKFPELLDKSKLAEGRRDEGDDSCTVRVGGYGNFLCMNPGNQATGTW